MDILVDDIFDYIGHFGFYHWILYALLCVLAIAQGYQVVSGVFVTYEQDFRCSIAALANLTLQQQERVAIPKNTEGAYDHCHVFTWDWNSHSPVGLGTDDLTNVTSHWNHTTVTSSMNLTIIPQEVPAIACNNFIFDETVFGASLQSQVHKFICRYLLFKKSYSWWRQQMETFSALLALRAGNWPVTGEFPSQRPETPSFDIFFELCLNKRLRKQSWDRWFETPSRSLWRHCYVLVS